jgi:hypothetical protein
VPPKRKEKLKERVINMAGSRSKSNTKGKEINVE